MFSERTGEVQNTFQHSKLSQQVGPVPLHPILRVVNYMEYGARTMKGAKVNGVNYCACSRAGGFLDLPINTHFLYTATMK